MLKITKKMLNGRELRMTKDGWYTNEHWAVCASIADVSSIAPKDRGPDVNTTIESLSSKCDKEVRKTDLYVRKQDGKRSYLYNVLDNGTLINLVYEDLLDEGDLFIDDNDIVTVMVSGCSTAVVKAKPVSADEKQRLARIVKVLREDEEV